MKRAYPLQPLLAADIFLRYFIIKIRNQSLTSHLLDLNYPTKFILLTWCWKMYSIWSKVGIRHRRSSFVLQWFACILDVWLGRDVLNESYLLAFNTPSCFHFYGFVNFWTVEHLLMLCLEIGTYWRLLIVSLEGCVYIKVDLRVKEN